MIGVFEDNDYYTGPQLDAGRVRQAEESLGVRLPRRYVELLFQRNGGVPRRRCCPTDFSTSWAPDHIQISAIRGIGGEWGIDSTSGLGSADMIAEWGYPEIGVVICDMPSALDDILTTPGTRRVLVNGGGFNGGHYYNRPDGTDAVFDRNGVFQYFGKF